MQQNLRFNPFFYYTIIQNFRLSKLTQIPYPISEHAKLGNIDIKFSDHYDRLRTLRSKGRYLNDTKDKDFGLSDFEADELTSLTNDLMEYTEKLMERVNVAKKPPIGEYCLLGRSNNL